MKNEMDVISLTKKLISFNTINPPGQEYESAKYIGRLLEQGGYIVDYYELSPNRLSLVAKIDHTGNQNPICLAGHLDTVPLGDLPWSTDPFNGHIEGDKIYGRGSTDMKGGIAAKIITALNLADKLKGNTKGLLLAFVASEETGCQGSYQLSELNVLNKAGAIIVGEPTSNYPLIGNKATLWLEAISSGKAAHGSTPELGVNAILKAAKAINKIEDFNFDIPENKYLGNPTINIGKIQGGTAFNIVPDKTVFTIDIRTIPGLTNDEALNKLQSYIGEEIQLRKIIDVGSVLSDPDNDWIQQVFDITEPFLKERPKPRALPGFTDASVLTPTLGNPPTIILGPGELSNAHQTDEFCYISKIKETVEIYTKIVKRWCNL